MRRLRLLLLLAALPACSSARDAVPGCPVCGDPVTHEGPDGRAVVVPRKRLAAWTPHAPTPDVR